MPRFMDRFARQNPNGASTRVSSGFTLPKHSSPSFGSDQRRSYSNPSEDIRIGRWCAPQGAPTSVRFHYAQGLVTRTLAPLGDSLVRVSRRAASGHYASVLAPKGAVLGRLPAHYAARYNTPLGEPHSRRLLAPTPTDAGPGPVECTGEEAG